MKDERDDIVLSYKELRPKARTKRPCQTKLTEPLYVLVSFQPIHYHITIMMDTILVTYDFLVLQSGYTIWPYQIQKNKLSVTWRGATSYGYQRSWGVWRESCSSNWSSEFWELEGTPLGSPVLGHKPLFQQPPAQASKTRTQPLPSPSPTVPSQNYKHCSSKSLLCSPGHQL